LAYAGLNAGDLGTTRIVELLEDVLDEVGGDELNEFYNKNAKAFTAVRKTLKVLAKQEAKNLLAKLSSSSED